MDTLEAIRKRRSIKKFLDAPIDHDILGMILDAGRLAPSAGNLQDYKLILIKKPENINAIAKACLNQIWINTANAIIVVATDKVKTEFFYKAHKDLFTVQTCAAAAENMIIAATSMGIASSWVSAFSIPELQKVLQMPENVSPQVVIPLGYSDEVTPKPPRHRLENIVCLEMWGGTIAKIKDVEWMLKDYNIVGRAIDKGNKFSKRFTKILKDIIDKFKKEKKKKKDSENKKKQEMPIDLIHAKKEIDKKK